MKAVTQENIDALLRLSLNRLGEMFVPEAGLFCHHVSGKAPVGVSVRYTVMVAIGLARARRFFEVPFDVSALLAAADAHADEVSCLTTVEPNRLSLGDLGLMLWAHCEARQMGGVGKILRRMRHLTHDWSPRKLMQTTAMELAWVHMGLVGANILGSWLSDDRLAVERVLLGRMWNARTGLFRQKAFGFRRRFANFACQIYPVLSLANSHKAFGAPETLDVARRCAGELIRNLNSDGGWPWLYDVQTGGVLEPMEVYSVHQHGMGPMALAALAEASGADYASVISRSVAWLYGNRFGLATVDEPGGDIFRSVRRKPFAKALGSANVLGALFAGSRRPVFGAAARTVELNRATRPYEYGWLLYAWSGRTHMLEPQQQSAEQAA